MLNDLRMGRDQLCRLRPSVLPRRRYVLPGSAHGRRERHDHEPKVSIPSFASRITSDNPTGGFLSRPLPRLEPILSSRALQTHNWTH